ncbi:GILT-like protein 1 [Battus philenor]|uniref:GILT-like protein 1 n=1 Tax=Battus philenor TaxID=42288 RepID=UPI0035D0064E
MFSLTIYLCFLISLAVADLQTVNGRIKITVGTTSGCGDTVSFINQQLVPAYELYGDFLELEIVPWGRTRRDGNGSLICQFGARDCWANRLHRCALHLLESNQDAQLQYMVCEFSSPFPSFLLNSYQCAESIGLSLNDIDTCFSTSSDVLEDIAEEKSLVPMQEINFVPFITFNDVIDVSLHNKARIELSNVICNALANDSATGISCSDNRE